MTSTPTRETIPGHAYVIPDLADLTAVQTFVRAIITDTALPVDFTVDTATMNAKVRIGRPPNSLTVPPAGVILIIKGVVYALDELIIRDPSQDTA